VNQKYELQPGLGRLTSPAGLDAAKLLPLRDKLWEDVAVINEYIASVKSLGSQEKAILIGWKQAVDGQFTVMKLLKNYAVLMTGDRVPLIYGVVGIYSTWDEMIPKERLPVVVHCGLLPFEGRIIYDSLLRGGNISYGPGYAKSFNAAYRSAKARYGIIESLDHMQEIHARHREDCKRQVRIEDIILANAYDERDENAAWQRHLKASLRFPFNAACTKQLLRSPLLPDEQVMATGLAKDDGNGAAAVVQWQGRTFAVPLEQLRPLGVDEKTGEAVGDWAYWCALH